MYPETDFAVIKNAVQRQFNDMKQLPLFRTDADKDTLYGTYLSSFPEGTNPMFRERTEHDCSCCRSFIRAVGDMVTIKDGKLISIWDVEVGGFYQVVADALSAYVKAQAITNMFLHTEPQAGVDKNYEQNGDEVITWQHFHITIPPALICKGVDIGTKLSDFRATHDVMLRSLSEITMDSVETVLELIGQNSLYRGAEHQHAVDAFRKLKVKFDKLPEQDKDLFVWSHVTSAIQSVSRIRNTAIGTLLVDLSDGVELDRAVASFESKVAPTNYKRPTALVTKAMIDKAKAQLEELGLVSALERRFAVQEDISVNNVLFADRSAKARMGGDVFDQLSKGVTCNVKTFDKVEEITIEKFMSDVLPTAKSMEILLENRHTPNLVSLVAPCDLTAPVMFKWGNPFSWSYNGEVADSMRAQVEKLGGRVDGALRFTHSWNHPDVGRNASLMDLHVFLPGSSSHKDGCHNNYPSGGRVGWNNRKDYSTGASQDVDYTDVAPEGYVPIENISFPALNKMPEGIYTFKIHNWSLRPTTKSGVRAEIEFGGNIYSYDLAHPLKDKEWVTLAEVTLKNGVFTIDHKLKSQQQSKQVWGLTTQTFHKVSSVMLSPNYWDDKVVGNKHFFFMLEGCVNEGTARGFYNEFLTSELDKHRKVFEMVGAKMKTEESPDQLSGLGFSSTQNNSVLVNVTGKFARVIKVTF